MERLIKIFLVVLLFNAVASSGFSQLRMPSPYSYDLINLDATRFVLNEGNTADFEWASEWTQDSARAYDRSTAIFLWHFKDGTKAYARQGEYIGDFGMLRDYLATDSASVLKDVEGNTVQPMTLKNYPVKLELWIGTVDDKAGFTTKTLLDAVCFKPDAIEYGHEYHFGECN
jgi:hypothetical protein